MGDGSGGAGGSGGARRNSPDPAWREFSLDELATAFGCSLPPPGSQAFQLLRELDLGYRPMSQGEHDEAVERIRRMLARPIAVSAAGTGTPAQAGPDEPEGTDDGPSGAGMVPDGDADSSLGPVAQRETSLLHGLAGSKGQRVGDGIRSTAASDGRFEPGSGGGAAAPAGRESRHRCGLSAKVAAAGTAAGPPNAANSTESARSATTVLAAPAPPAVPGADPSGPGRLATWDRGWADSAARFAASGGSLDELTPGYFARHQEFLRWQNRFIVPRRPRLHLDLFTVLRVCWFHSLFAPFDPICEFGCGTGINLVLLAKLFPGKRLIGFDWSAPAVELVGRVAAQHRLPITAHRLDLFAPDPAVIARAVGRRPGEPPALTPAPRSRLGPGAVARAGVHGPPRAQRAGGRQEGAQALARWRETSVSRRATGPAAAGDGPGAAGQTASSQVGRMVDGSAWPSLAHAAVFTSTALEQLGSGFRPFLQGLAAAGPGVVLHFEPILELYEPREPFDRLAIGYHRQRGYLQGFLPALRELADARVLELVTARRIRFGGGYHDAYSTLVWRGR